MKCCGRVHALVWITSSLAVLIIVSLDGIVKLSQGAEFSKGDIIFIVVVISACVLAIVITVGCHIACRRKQAKRNETSGLFTALCCCADDGVSEKLKDVSKFGGSDCAICLEEKDPLKKSVVEISCSHTYHKACISKCLEIDNNAKCPKCRRQPTSYSSWNRLTASIQTLIQKRHMREINYTAQPVNENYGNSSQPVPGTSCDETEALSTVAVV